MMPYLIVLLVPKGPKSTSYNTCLDQLIRGYDLIERETTYPKSSACAKICFNAVFTYNFYQNNFLFPKKTTALYYKINSMAL